MADLNTVCCLCLAEQIKPEHIVGDDSADNEEETQRGEKIFSHAHSQFISGLNSKDDPLVWGQCVRVSGQLTGMSFTLLDLALRLYILCAFFMCLLLCL